MHQDDSTEHITIERLKHCQEIVGRSRRPRASRNPEEYEPSTPKPSAFEPACRGSYESCQLSEVISRDLERFSFKETTDNYLSGKQLLKRPSTAEVPHTEAAPQTIKRISSGEYRAQEQQDSSEASCLGFRTAREQYILNELKARMRVKYTGEPRKLLWI